MGARDRNVQRCCAGGIHQRHICGANVLNLHRAAWLPAFILTLCFGSASSGQSLDDHVDEDRYLRGLSDLILPEVLEHYIELYPPEDELAETEYQLALDRMRLRDRQLSPQQRETIVQSMIARRDELIRNNPGDRRLPLWLADQATDLYFELLPIEAALLTSHHGIPTPRQRDRAQRGVESMLHYASLAAHSIDRVLLDLENSPGYSESISLQLERRALAEQQRDRRMPFLHGIAAYLHAELNLEAGAEREEMLVLSRQLLASLPDKLHVPLNDHAQLYAAFAALRLGETETARRELTTLVGRESLDEALRFSAQLGIAQSPRELSRLAGQYRGRETLFYRLIVADALFKIHHDTKMQEAVAAYTDLLERDFGVGVDQMRDIVFDRLVRAIDPDAPPASLPPIAAIAQAGRIVQDDAQRQEAIATLDTMLESETVRGDDRALALLTLGRAHHADEHPLDAARQFITLAREHPTNRDAERAIEWGASLAAEVYQSNADEARTVLREALDVLLSQFANLRSINRWRYTAGQLALREGRFGEALDHFRSVRVDSDQGADAAFMQAQTLRQAAAAAVPARQDELYRDTITATREARVRALHSLERARDVEEARHFRNRLAALEVVEAEALVKLGNAREALQRLAELDLDDDLPGTIVAEALQVRIEAHQHNGDVERAQRELDRFLEASPDRAAAVLVPWMTSVQRQVEQALDDHDEHAAQQLARRELKPLARRSEQWLTETSARPEHRAALLPRIADAYRLSEQYSAALPLYERLLNEHPSSVQVIFGRAECLFHLAEGGQREQQLGDAMILYRRIVTAGPEVGVRYYWQSHLRSLQILDRIGRNTQQIVPQIQRLRQRDNDLGGERFRREFDRLQAKYS